MRPRARPGSAQLGSAGRGVAGESLGIAYLKLHRPDLAGPVFAAVGRDRNVPDSIRTRAVQMAGSLGINDSDTTAPPGAASPPAQAAGQAQPAGPAQPAPAATRDNGQ